ncbi:hypothetical protein KY285_010824 [Solanum tuberosum]|nr:hypothetical protein KY289_011396 [Solanum tuberosum]KAH0735117.1 hypothetical protein KY285_010824 [Solanum tuberosum]
MSISSSDIQRIQVEFLKDDTAQKTPPPNSSLVVYPATLTVEDNASFPFEEQVGIHIPSFDASLSDSTTTSTPSSSVSSASRVVKCEKIARVHTVRLNEFTATIALLEKTEGSTSGLDTLMAEVAKLKAEVVQIQSVDISTLWGEVPFSDVAAPTPVMPSVAPSSSVREVIIDEDDDDEELAEETNGEVLREDENGFVETLRVRHETEEVII